MQVSPLRYVLSSCKVGVVGTAKERWRNSTEQRRHKIFTKAPLNDLSMVNQDTVRYERDHATNRSSFIIGETAYRIMYRDLIEKLGSYGRQILGP